MNLKRLADGVSAMRAATTRGAYDNSIRLLSVLLLLVSLAGLVGCDTGPSPVDPSVQITCGNDVCVAHDSYCVVTTGGSAGQGGGGTTSRCVPFSSGCSHGCRCALRCDQCTQDSAGAVTVIVPRRLTPERGV